MIYLKISNFELKNNLYLISLGNGASFQFKSEKSCRAFLVKASKFLTEKFNELNLLFADAFLLYRHNYFYFDNNHHSPHADLYETRRQVNRLNSTIETTLERLSFSANSTSSNRTNFVQLFFVCDCITQILILIKSVNSTKSFAAVDIRADYLLSQAQSIKSELQQFELKKAISYEASQANTTEYEKAALLRIVS